MAKQKIYVLKGTTKCNIRHNGVSYFPDSPFYAEASEKDAKFLMPFLKDATCKEKSTKSEEPV